jgi:hypothetical protein
MFTATNKETGKVVKAADVYYFRFRVENYGWSTAEDVEVSIEEVKKFQGKGYEIDQDFMPLRLVWSHWKMERPEMSIPSGAYRHCDFGFIIDPNAPHTPLPTKENDELLFWLDVFLRPNTGRTSLLPGKYQITISAFGKNVKRTTYVLEMEWKGIWALSIQEILTKSVIVL